MSENKNILYILFVVSFVFLLRSAWICDDAFITLRTVDNWIHGHGLTWNPAERVQTFTHPLWLLGMSVVYFFMRDGYFSVIVLSLVVSSATFYIFQRYFSGDLWSLLFAALGLLLSKSFLDFSTSGLENPLSHLILLIFMIRLLSNESLDAAKSLFMLILLAGLGMTNRLDLAVIFLPSLLYVYMKHHRSLRGLGIILVGLTPFILWMIFSLVYYGFVLPNTFYAKLNVGVSHFVMMKQGLLYYLNSIAWDPITLAVITTALALTFAAGDWKRISLGIGVVIYMIYIVYIGGDYMSGRFFSVPYIACLMLLIIGVREYPLAQKIAIPAFLLVLGFLSPHPTFSYFSRMLTSEVISQGDAGMSNDDWAGIADERFYYDARTSLFVMDREMKMPDTANIPWADGGRECREECPKVVTRTTVGLFGYFAGPNVHILDILAIGDPFLARLPVQKQDWRIGHFRRPLVDGYFETLDTGENQIKDPYLAEYYDKLKVIISGPIWSVERFKLIWEFNTGQHDDLVEKGTK
jgi:arabinofuranosyltransferase